MTRKAVLVGIVHNMYTRETLRRIRVGLATLLDLEDFPESDFWESEVILRESEALMIFTRIATLRETSTADGIRLSTTRLNQRYTLS